MKIVPLFLVSPFFLWSSSSVVAAETTPTKTKVSLIEKLFDEWSVRFGRKYASLDERQMRMKVWVENNDVIERHNSKEPKPSFKLGHNNFSDLTLDEFQQRFRLGEYSPRLSSEQEEKLSERTSKEFLAETERRMMSAEMLPKEIDWVQYGAVTEVKDQGPCGSCWSFSATGSIEGARYLKVGELVSLSEQNLMDCDTHNDKACNGGLMDNAFTWDHYHLGLCTEADYPYVAAPHTRCLSHSCKTVSDTRVLDFVDIGHDDLALRSAVTQQPISVAIEANQQVFQLYASGVFDPSSCGSDIDHGVLMVGYGTDDETGEDYYTIKNSWGVAWGENGYIRMSRATSDSNGPCGLYMLSSYPVV